MEELQELLNAIKEGTSATQSAVSKLERLIKNMNTKEVKTAVEEPVVGESAEAIKEEKQEEENVDLKMPNFEEEIPLSPILPALDDLNLSQEETPVEETSEETTEEESVEHSEMNEEPKLMASKETHELDENLVDGTLEPSQSYNDEEEPVELSKPEMPISEEIPSDISQGEIVQPSQVTFPEPKKEERLVITGFSESPANIGNIKGYFNSEKINSMIDSTNKIPSLEKNNSELVNEKTMVTNEEPEVKLPLQSEEAQEPKIKDSQEAASEESQNLVNPVQESVNPEAVAQNLANNFGDKKRMRTVDEMLAEMEQKFNEEGKGR